MNGLSHLDPDCSDFVEVDPSGRYGRYNEVLGKGASKTVYKAFDEYEGIEVAWNQVKLYDFLQNPEDLVRLYCEIHLLKTLKHKNLMKFYTSWVDTANRNINFITEMFTSGTLRQYRLKHRRVNISAVKHWCRQILRGLHYLHSLDPPVIHRDLKCDNIFINGNQGEVKIGDLGLAAILRKSHAAHCVGTPEFMAPEVYEEAYNELVDIYSFGMCVLEMVTFEYPYSECSHPAQIYKKVISGKKPDVLYKVKDPEVRHFVEKCLATVSHRLSARELLDDPFLRIDDCDSNSLELDYGGAIYGTCPLIKQPYTEIHDNMYSYSNRYSYEYSHDACNEVEYCPLEVDPSGIELFEHHDDEHCTNVDISIKGKKRDDDSVFLRLRISDKEGRIRNIYFPFDVESDTALSVATEMIAELDITDQDVTKIAEMIDGEISSLVPEWRPGPGIIETPRFANQTVCRNCASTCTSNGSFTDYWSHDPFCPDGCASMHGRFEEITFEADQPEHHLTEGAPNALSQSDHHHYPEAWVQHESRELTPVGSGRSHSDEEYEKLDISLAESCDKKEIKTENEILCDGRNSIQHLSGSGSSRGLPSFLNTYRDEIQQKLRCIKTKYHMDLRKPGDQHVGVLVKSSASGYNVQEPTYGVLSSANFHFHLPESCPDSDDQSVRNCLAKQEFVDGDLVTAKSCCSTSSSLPNTMHRTISLPVDAIDGL